MRIEERKAQLRRVERDLRLNGAAARERERESRVIQQHLLRAFPPRPGARVALYAAVRGEVDTDRLRSAFLASGAEVYYPVLGAEGNLSFHRHGPGDGWVEGRFGLREPRVADGDPGRTDGFDLIVVPGLAFDRAGRRLGQGYGSYDRFLMRLSGSVPTAGLAYSWQIVDEVPADAWDVPVDMVVTKDGIIRAAGNSLRGVRQT